MYRKGDVAESILRPLRKACLELPEAFEEPAWLGTRWKIRTRTFAHVLRIEDGRPESYSKVSGVDETAVVLTFRAAEDEVAALSASGLPFFLPGWWPNIVGLILDGTIDDEEIAELITDSYCILAPKKCAALVHGDA
ncbi:MAG: MmcQ/YjbR family DNA-binding protein [Actinomycetota bacterium]|nr:MmcQ/YjbR family DNA-binding protein [Actinomycetota bacterium]